MQRSIPATPPDPDTDGRAAVDLRGVLFGYRKGADVLRIPELRIPRGQTVFLYGPSGSGKTTLLGLLAGVLRSRSGRVEVLGRDLTCMRSSARDAFRGANIGYIFQMFNLVPYLSVLDNITLPCRVSAERRRRLGGLDLDAAARAMAVHLGIDGIVAERVTNLSVGQQQRVAAARALLGSPPLVIADEPTSALDTERREDFLRLLFERCRAAGSTLLFVSHDRSLASSFDRSVSILELGSPC